MLPAATGSGRRSDAAHTQNPRGGFDGKQGRGPRLGHAREAGLGAGRVVVGRAVHCGLRRARDRCLRDRKRAGGAGGSSGLDRETVVSGLKEALRVGTERSVSRTARPGGFLDDSLLRIALPEELDTVAQGLRALGLGAQVDALEVSMNRAAERASGEATDVFWQAVSSMSVSDAFGILNGPQDAATRYFRDRTENTLRTRFTPIVDRAMQEVGLYRSYEAVVSRTRALPLLGCPTWT